MDTEPEARSPVVSALGLAGFVGATASAVALGGTSESGKSLWYRRLKKPPFQPPSSVFPPVWTVLYGLIAVSGWRVWKKKPATVGRSRALQLWAVQMTFNSAWSYLFFKLRRPRAALVDIGLLLGSIALYTRAAKKVDAKAPLLMAPYLGWVSFASALNAEIVRRNPSE